MNTGVRTGATAKHSDDTRTFRPSPAREFRLAPIARALALTLAAGAATATGTAHAQATGGAWFAAQGANQNVGAQRGNFANRAPGARDVNPVAEQQKANAQLQRSIGNLNLAARGIAAQQAAQAAARLAAAQSGAGVPDGLADGGLKVDTAALTQGWRNARGPVQSQQDGRTHVAIEQTADKAILNWETFNVGRNTTVDFKQQAGWAVLNRVNDPNARPSQIQGQIKGDGTVMVVNRNGVVFNGTAQVNVRNLVVAAANITDAQFDTNGIYSPGAAAGFTGAQGLIDVQAGARISTHGPSTSTQGGGYVLLLGQEVNHAGDIATPKGQAALAAGDSFVIRRGVGTDGNQASTTRGNEITPQFAADSLAGKVSNSGLIMAREGDITLIGRAVRQNGVVVATTSVNTRGTVHLNALNAAAAVNPGNPATPGNPGEPTDPARAPGKITLGEHATTAILIEADTTTTALNSQRDGLRIPAVATDANIVIVNDRRDQSRIEMTSGGTVDFRSDSLTLATGGQIVVNAGQRSLVRERAQLDVSGAVGVTVAMESNNVKVNIQGNEQRDAPVNRDSTKLNSNDVWIDRRTLVFVPKGTNGYDSDRWYTAGGLLEVAGYLGTQGHTVGEWMAQGGTVSFAGSDVVTRAGSNINLSGGTLNVQTGQINQSWLRGADGRLYEVSRAPGDLLYTGLYKGYEDKHARWGEEATGYYYNPLIAPRQRTENGYTAGRDAGTLVISTAGAVLEGDITSEAFQGEQQTRAPQAGLDGYSQSQQAVARRGQLIVGRYVPLLDKTSGSMHYALEAAADHVEFNDTRASIATGLDLATVLPQEHAGRLVLNTAQLNAFGLGAIRVAAKDSITVDSDVQVGAGGNITLYGPAVHINAGLTAHAGTIRVGNVLEQPSQNLVQDTTFANAPLDKQASVAVAENVVLDTTGLWSNLKQDPANAYGLAWLGGGTVQVRSTGDISLGRASRIDVSSGAALKADDGQQGGRGGSATVEIHQSGTGSLLLDGQIAGHGVTGGGTLTIQAPHVRVGSASDDTLALDAGFFDKGFSRYHVIGSKGLTVEDGTHVNVALPVYRFTAQSQQVATGARTADALERWTSPLYQEDPVNAVLKQRAGASLLLQAGTSLTPAADLSLVQARIGQGAVITVDPGQSITVNSVGQLTVEGRLQAAGGTITLATPNLSQQQQDLAVGVAHNRSIWLGEHAVLDVAAQAATASDAQGGRYGLVHDGGTIVIGGEIDEALGESTAANNFIVVSRGARLDASGTSAMFDLPGQGAVVVGSNGGKISLASNNGLYLYGTMQAVAGAGEGTAGGTLHVALEQPEVQVRNGSAQFPLAEAAVGGLRSVVIGARQGDSVLAQDLLPEVSDAALRYGYARLGVDQVQQGGFNSLAILSAGNVSIEAGTQLKLNQRLSFYTSGISLAADAALDARVDLGAGYLRWGGYTYTPSQNVNLGKLGPATPAPALPQLPDAQLTMHGGLIDLRDRLQVAGFGQVLLASDGDMRFLGGRNAGPLGVVSTSLSSPGALTLRADQIYPATGVTASVTSGASLQGAYLPESLLRIEHNGRAAPAMPHAVFGALTLDAAIIEQGGVLRVPLGNLIFGTANTLRTHFLPGSETSVSGNGILMPYGGTVDGLNYLYNGVNVVLAGLGGVNTAGQALSTGMTLNGARVDVQPGAVVDLSGGGELTGAGFISGRGGSTDARYHPLVATAADGSFQLPGLDTNPIYAIVPGVQARQAPAGGEQGAVDPVIGQQITLAHGVPGLPPGTYTLMPSTYALMPGAFRVELNRSTGQGPAFASHALRNGSWSAAAKLSVAGTGLTDVNFHQAILTSADVVRRYSQYDQTSFSSFVVNDAIRKGVSRAMLPADVRTLLLRLTGGPVLNAPGGEASDTSEPGVDALHFDGIGRFTPAAGGYGGSVAVIAYSPIARNYLEIVAPGASATEGFTGVSLDAEALNRFGASRLMVGGLQYSVYGAGGNIVQANSQVRELTLRSGAVLSAPEVFLMTDGNIDYPSRLIVEQGAGINTIGRGRAAYDSADGFIYGGSAGNVVAVSNGLLTMLPVLPTNNPNGTSSMEIGACAQLVCTGQTALYSEGTIALTTPDRFVLDDAVRYGTRNLTLAVQGINVGEASVLAQAQATNTLPSGLVLNQSVMDRLLRGDTQFGAPALETLSLNARNGINFFGTTSLDTVDPVTGKSSLARLVLTTPAIYGHGGANSVATLRTGHLYWTGTTDTPVAAVAGGAGTGTGTLLIDATRIELGYAPGSQPTGTSNDARLTLGFNQVNLQASERITANNKGSLSVYQSQGAYEAGKGYAYSGGHLNLVAPLITGAAGSINRMTAGGQLIAQAPQGTAARTTPVLDAALGAELSLVAQGLVLDSTIALPSGKLSLNAQDNLLLAGNAYLDLAGRKVDFNDVSKYSWGGDVTLESRHGNVQQAVASVIDISAQNNRAGTLRVLALSEQAGVVDLQGQLKGGASGHYDAAGTLVPYRAGGIEIRAQRIGEVGGGTDTVDAQFATLNQRLNDGGVVGMRTFQIKQGDLTIGNDVRAGEVNVSIDRGSLTVAGTINASGERVGSIHLAAGRNLTLAAGSVLDAHGSMLRVDSYGKIIDSPNRAIVVLTARDGQLTLAQGATVDLRHGTGAQLGTLAGQNDGRDRGTLTLNAPRVGSGGLRTDADAETFGDMAIDARGALNIQGARMIAVNAVQRYDDAPLVTTPGASGRPYQQITQDWLKGKHDQNTLFVNAALARTALVDGKLAGLNNARYADAFHLRPGVEITSNTVTNPGGDLVVSGDLDLSGYRYASLNPHTQQRPLVYGSGEVGALSIRAAGNLDIFGSINDGFMPPPATHDDNGWLLLPGVNFTGGDVVIPRAGVVLADGTTFEGGTALNFDLPIKAYSFAAGTLIPTASVLLTPLQLPIGTVLGADIHDAAGNLLYAAGSVVGASVTLPAQTRLGAGTRLSGRATLAAMIWPKGMLLPAGTFVMDGSKALPVGAMLPAATNIKLEGDAKSVDLRPNGAGRLWALATMLPEGSQSWSLQLVAGADLSAGDPRTLQTHPEAGSLRLADAHYGLFAKALPSGGGFAWNQAAQDEIGDPRIIAGEMITDEIAQEYGYPDVAGLCADNVAYCVPKSSFTFTEAAALELGEFFPGFVAGAAITDAYINEISEGAYPTAASYCADAPTHCASSGEVEYEYLPGSNRFSVLRTGAADLDLRAGGNIDMLSTFGVYTAGISSQSTQVGDPYNLPRAVGSAGTVLIDTDGGYEKFVDGGEESLARAWYPAGGGNLTLVAGGTLTGDIMQPFTSSGNGRPKPLDRGTPNASTQSWLWRQGTGDMLGNGQDQSTAWWINFGTYVSGTVDSLVGFTGYGTLGGGNVSVDVGGDAGILARRGATLDNQINNRRSQGLIVAVGSTGRVLADGSLDLTGGGDVNLRIGGTLNPFALASDFDSGAINAHLFGSIANLRGDVQIQAGAIGIQSLMYSRNVTHEREVRAFDPYTASRSAVQNGIVLAPGDASFGLATRSDLVLTTVNDPGREVALSATPFTRNGMAGSGSSWFTLWTPDTAINLFSAGGDLTPVRQAGGTLATDLSMVYPSILNAVAASGNLYYGAAATPTTTTSNGALVLAPSPNQQLAFLAMNSIYGGGFIVSPSGAPESAMATPLHPAFSGTVTSTGMPVDNLVSAGSRVAEGRPLFALGANTASAPAMGTNGEPARFYAVTGDLLGVDTGRIVTFRANDPMRAGQTWYEGGRPVWMMAGRDIVGSGTPLGEDPPMGNGFSSSYTVTGNVFVHHALSDVSVVSAGRDIIYSGFNVAGPGTLEITAGRNIRMEDRTGVSSLGAVVPGDTRPGAQIAMLAGVGAKGANYSGLLSRYLAPDNQAQAGTPLAEQPGRVVKTYQNELLTWLSDADNGLGFTGTAADAPAFFAALPPEQQRIFARQVYFAELLAGGREYNDAEGPRFGSYLRGREAIATLFPTTDGANQPSNYSGDIIMFRGTKNYTDVEGLARNVVRSGYVRTLFGGDIQMLSPGGRQVFGVEGAAPPASSGVLTQGEGDISLYSLGSILLGQSRIMTTFGGGILGWSAAGDINAGRGSKTTLVYTPPKRVYDQWGNVTLSSDVPSTGAGIATLAPIAEVPAGDIDLIAPLGTIDAGEAGIRVSGNVNLAALQVVNAANIAVQGDSVGVPALAAVNVGALTNASAAASQASTAAQDTVQRARAEARQNLPSIITVRVLGFGNDPAVDSEGGSRPVSSNARQGGSASYDAGNLLQLVGNGKQYDPAQVARLTTEEKEILQRH